jgi:hypothetical protein
MLVPWLVRAVKPRWRIWLRVLILTSHAARVAELVAAQNNVVEATAEPHRAGDLARLEE